MNKDTVLPTEDPVQDVLTIFLRESAQKMLQLAIEQEVIDFIEAHQEKRLADGRQRVVKNGYLPVRKIQTGIGGIEVKAPRVRDREQIADKIQYSSCWVPKHMRRTATLDVWLPILYLKGISTGDFQSALEPLLGKHAACLSPSVISRLKSNWLDEYHL